MIDAKCKTVKTFVVEEEEIYRYMYELLPSRGPVKLLGVSSNFKVSTVDEIATTHRPEVLLLGTGRLDSQFIEELQEFRGCHPEIGLIILFSQYSNQDIEALRKLALKGASGLAVFLKQSLKEIEQILGIILAVTRGNIILDPTLATFIFGGKSGHPFLEQLTPRELEILSLLSNGSTNLAIAEALYIDIKTVEHHLNSMYSKLRAESDTSDKHMRVAAARLYLQEVEGLPSSR